MDITREQLAEVANEVTRIKAESYGKGPTEAKAYLNGNVLVCVLRGGLTTVERTLIAGGDEKLVQQVRLRYQEQMTDTFTAAVERITGCRVAGYASQVTFDPDYGFEIAVLADGAPEVLPAE